MKTELLYLSELNATECNSQLLDIIPEAENNSLMLDQTVFYPQGGGQPYDTGTIQHGSATFIVTEVRFVDGLVKHKGKFTHGRFAIGDTVHCQVNEDRRLLNSRLHSAGHVVDMAVAQLNLPWIPGKGFHFPEGPYVEYEGALDDQERESLRIKIEQICNKLITDDLKTTLLFVPAHEMQNHCHFVPTNLPANKPSRVVKFGPFGVPCGGTHVSHLGTIGTMTIRKIKLEKGAIRVSYDVPRS